MIYKTRLLVSSLLLCSALVACGDNDNEAAKTPTTAETATINEAPTSSEAVTSEAATSEMADQSAASNTAMPTDKIEAGMTEQSVTDLLGKPTLTQTHTLDSLTMIHSEWTNDSGTTSVQFQNGIVQFTQFTATK